jgi:hypothetical protein
LDKGPRNQQPVSSPATPLKSPFSIYFQKGKTEFVPLILGKWCASQTVLSAATLAANIRGKNSYAVSVVENGVMIR